MTNTYFIIFGIDILLMVLFFLLGWYAVEKEHKDNWGDSETMEFKKSRKLSDEWAKKHPILDFFQCYYYELRRKKDLPMDTYRNIKWFIQRGKRGYSERDVWGFNYYLNKVIIGGIRYLQKNKSGCPCMVDEGDIPTENGQWTDEGSDIAQKKWEDILAEIRWTFETESKFNDHNLIPVFDEKERKEKQDLVDRLNKPDNNRLFPEVPQQKYSIMSKEEMKRYHEGWELFKKYFQCLWD